jgi:hypothetical protein
VQKDGRKICHLLSDDSLRNNVNYQMSLEEYAERPEDLASDGYRGTPEKFIQIVATDA